ncbi:anti-sigma-D factor RsdA [Actinopolyspora mortivallis]|uniref:anti-sigma-D factor RsdA n=1 Tax=Actinopolyspora mortivallis TaxID=33906 RepID=UPI00037AD462|nr:anti-sigma-D factor RsdA [Actinopolyspora mortivallis]
MAERSGSGGDDNERAPVEPGQQDDRSNAEYDDVDSTAPVNGGSGAERGAPHGDSEREDTADRDPEAGAEGTERFVETPKGSDGEQAAVIEFRPRQDPSAENPEHSPEFSVAEEAGEEDLDTDGDPVDLAEVRADDELLDLLGSTEAERGDTADSEADLEALLLAWRREVDSAPVGELVDTDRAVAAVEEGRPRRRARRRRHLVPVATAAAVLMITFTGVGVAARDAGPGDALWGVTQVLYSDRAASAAAASRAENQLELASRAWQRGEQEEAETALHRAAQQLRTVEPGERSDLRETHASLSAKFQDPPEFPDSSSSEETSSTREQGPPPSGSSEAPPESSTPPSTGDTTPPSRSEDQDSTSHPPEPSESPSTSVGESRDTSSDGKSLSSTVG